MKWKSAIRSLEECERTLRQYLAEAAADGDYTGVLRIAELAKAVGAIAAEAQRGTDPSDGPDGRTPVFGTAPSSQDVARATTPLTPQSGKAASGGKNYPKFFRRRDELVKVGWSKKAHAEYNHRAPRRAVLATAAAVRQTGAQGKLFNGDALLPLRDQSDGSVVPSYQAYVALAWLSSLGIVRQHGARGGYSVAPHKQIDSAVTAAWSELPEWRG